MIKVTSARNSNSNLSRTHFRPSITDKMITDDHVADGRRAQLQFDVCPERRPSVLERQTALSCAA
jgi:hypothetical protein